MDDEARNNSSPEDPGSHRSSPPQSDRPAGPMEAPQERPHNEHGEAAIDDAAPPPDPARIDRRFGILSKQEIEDLKLIANDDPPSYQATSYDLRLGDQHILVGDTPGKMRSLSTWIIGRRVPRFQNSREPRTVSVPPFGRLFFQTEEELQMPLDVVARFDLKLKWAIKGLFVQVGAQVEAGYKGRLYGLIVNTSEKPVIIGYRDKFLVIEFHWLAQSVKQDDAPTSSVDLEGFLASLRKKGVIDRSDMGQQGLISHLQARIADLEKHRFRWSAALGTFAAIFSILLTLVTMFLKPAVQQWANEGQSQQTSQAKADDGAQSANGTPSADRVIPQEELRRNDSTDQSSNETIGDPREDAALNEREPES